MHKGRDGSRSGALAAGCVALAIVTAFGCRKSEPEFVQEAATSASVVAEPSVTAALDLPDDHREKDEQQRPSALPTGRLDEPKIPDPTGPIPLEVTKRPVITQVIASELEGKLTQEQVMNTIDENASRLVGCLSTDSVISIRLKVLPSGKIGVARAIRSIPNDPKLRDCIESAIRKIAFPKLEGNEPANLSLDLSLKKS